MASLILRAERCTMCGTSDWEWLEDPEAYVPTIRSCMGCNHKARAMPDDVKPRPGDHVVLLPRREAARLKVDPSAPRHGPRLKKRTRRRQVEPAAD